MSGRGAGGPVFSGQTPSKPEERTSRPSRPMADYRERMAREAQRARAPFRRRLARVLPLFGFLGIREFGLAVVVLSMASTWFWDHRYLLWGLLGSLVGFVIMRSGQGWLEG